MYYTLTGILLTCVFFAFASGPSDQEEDHYQKTGHNPLPPPQTSNAVFSRTQKATFEDPSPRMCDDGKVALKGEKCSPAPPPSEQEANSPPIQYYSE